MKPLAWAKKSGLLTDAQRARAADPFTAAMVAEIELLLCACEAAEIADVGDHFVRYALNEVHRRAIRYVTGPYEAWIYVDDLRSIAEYRDGGYGARANALVGEVAERLYALLPPARRAYLDEVARDRAARAAEPPAPSAAPEVAPDSRPTGTTYDLKGGG